MAEGTLFNLSGNVLELLRSFVGPELLSSDLKNEIEILNNTVSVIRAVILDAERQGYFNHQIKVWLSDLKDVLYDAEDLLDDFSTEVLRQKVMTGNKMKKEVRIFFSSSNPISFGLKMIYQIKEIRERLNEIVNQRMKFHLSESFIEPQVMGRDRETYSLVLEEEVVGFENDKSEILKRILDYSDVDNISIIPIVGIGGMGKTKLAQLVYNDEFVKSFFELKIWICVSNIFDVKRIVKDILEQLITRKHEERKHEESLEMLQNQLQQELNGKKYLIVLDDMWNEDSYKWNFLKNLLMRGATGSTIIVTTRSELVAKITGTTSWHALRGLPKENAWELFAKIAFRNGQLPENQTLISLGKEIVSQCGGVPLAIRTIASLLHGKISEVEWQSFIKYELPKIALEETNYILSTLKLSYDHLPSYLKQCFAYCRLFPKGYKINIETLINLWAAQGFIKLSDSKQRVEDVGQGYFMELLWRSFFQDVEKDELGNILYCKMHNLMHDLASHMAGTESIMLTSEENISKKVRHLSFDPKDLLSDPKDSSKQLPILMVKGMRIRTVLVASVGINFSNLTCDALITNLNYLRALDLSKLKLRVVPLSIGELKHLRYLDLSENEDVEFLPNSITKLLNLQTLKLMLCESLKELPQGIKKLVNLRHLDITLCRNLTHLPLGLGYLTSLEILPEFVVRHEGVKVSSSSWYKKKQARSSGGLSELKELNNLGGSLLIRNLGHGRHDMLECKAINMKQKQHLQVLELSWEEWDGKTECYDEMSLKGLQPHPNLKMLGLFYYMGVTISSWVSLHTNLVDLGLYQNSRVQHLPPLNQLPALKSVTLDGMKALEYISEDSSSSKTAFFPKLSSLQISECPNLKGWWRQDDVNEPDHLLLPSFPHLFELQIVGCPKLTSMPLFPYLKESLELNDSSLKVLEQTMEMTATTSTFASSSSSSCYFPLSHLKSLVLVRVNDLESLPEKWLQNLSSLQTLYITKCFELESLPWIGSLTSLQRLFIHECPNLTSLPRIRDLKYLQHLAIAGCPLLLQKYQRQTGEDWLNIAHVPYKVLDWHTKEKISESELAYSFQEEDLSTQDLPYFAGHVLSTPLIKNSKESSETKESGESEEKTDADIETTSKVKGIKLEQDESNEEGPSSLSLEDKPSLPTSQDPVTWSLPMSQTPNSRNEADVLTNTLSNQDGVQDLSFESKKVSEKSELMDLPMWVHSLKIEGCDDLEFIPQGQVLSTPVIKNSKQSSETKESGESEEETDADIEKTLKAEEIKIEQDESNEEDSSSPFSEDKPSLPTQVLTNTRSDQDGMQDLSFESMEVSEISELMDLPTWVRSLKIEGCDDLEFIPKGVMSSELSLQDLYIINCCSLTSFPEDHPPTALKILYIRNCKKLNFPLTIEKKTRQDALLEYLCIGSSCDSLELLSLDLFPNLKSLSIWDCANLQSLSMPEGIQKKLTSLEALEIRDCPNLVSFPEGGLPTPKLTSIWLSNCKRLEKLPDQLHTLNSLQSMFINNCPELVSLSKTGLPSRLSLLSITFCNKLRLNDEWGLDGLHYLSRLEIEGGCVDVESFPEKLLPSNLSSLRISRLLNLKNLDNKGFQQLTSLQRLEISHCPNLRSLPEDGFPSSLSFLCVKECSLLTSKFRNKKGRDWSKIDHISCIEIDEEVIS